jgi:hypothetical protein
LNPDDSPEGNIRCNLPDNLQTGLTVQQTGSALTETCASSFVLYDVEILSGIIAEAVHRSKLYICRKYFRQKNL